MINLFQVTNGELEECEEQKLAVYEKLKVDFFSSEIQNKPNSGLKTRTIAQFNRVHCGCWSTRQYSPRV